MNISLEFSFPNSIWERPCGRNSIAAAGGLRFDCNPGNIPAIELPGQLRSQIEFGNEERKEKKMSSHITVQSHKVIL